MGKHQEGNSRAPDIKGALFRARGELVRAGIESPHLTAELLLGHVLQKPDEAATTPAK